MFRDPGAFAPLSLVVPVLLFLLGLAVTAVALYLAVRAGVRDGIRSAHGDRDPGSRPPR